MEGCGGPGLARGARKIRRESERGSEGGGRGESLSGHVM